MRDAGTVVAVCSDGMLRPSSRCILQQHQSHQIVYLQRLFFLQYEAHVIVGMTRRVYCTDRCTLYLKQLTVIYGLLRFSRQILVDRALQLRV